MSLLLKLATATALLQQPTPVAAPDTFPEGTFDSPETQALVERAIENSATIPESLRDYEAAVYTNMFITLTTDSATAGDLPATVDDIVSTVQWNARGALRQRVEGHRTRLLIPLPYTLGTLLERPWVIPHLYGSSIYTPFLGPQAINPFGSRGPEFYSYNAGEQVQLRIQNELITLMPIEVRPRRTPGAEEEVRLVLGAFYLDVDRGAVARARYGFAGGAGEVIGTIGRIETFLDLENALWQGQYWLPYQQRRDITFDSRILGGAATARVINRFGNYSFNTGFTPTPGEDPVSLVWATQEIPDAEAFAQWEDDIQEIQDIAVEYSVTDFADLRQAVQTASRPGDAPRYRLSYRENSHLFRYNRVEGLYLGLAGRVTPAWPSDDNRWEVYGTTGWAFAEKAVRGELFYRRGMSALPRRTEGVDYGFEVGAYRRLLDMRSFRPAYDWDWIHSLPALLWGSDDRDYYDTQGAEAFALARSGRWSARVGGRYEEHDSVSVNTTRFLFGTAEDFDEPLAGVDPGTHAALEGTVSYTKGPGAFSIGNSTRTQLSLESGFADFDFQRVSGLISARRNAGIFTLAGRLDGGHVFGSGAPAQKLFRFGSREGLRGFEHNEFGGSTVLLARSRLLVGLPPYSSEPLFRKGFVMIPPLRPSLVLTGESGWASVSSELEPALFRLGSSPTEGWRSSVGIGISILDDALTAEYLHPIGEGSDGRSGRWYFGLATWY